VSFGARIRNTLDVISSVAIIVVAGVLVWSLWFQRAPSPAEPRPQVESVTDLRIDADQIRHQIGDGTVAIVEFGDFQCPFCRKHATDTLPRIQQAIIETGQARYVTFHYPISQLHSDAEGAAAAAECAGRSGQFWKMYEVLFANSKELSRMDLIRYAKELGIEQAQFESCLDNEVTQRQISTDREEGKRLGVSGTPAFFVGRVLSDGSIELITRIRGAAPIDVFTREVQNVAARS
jgi:protein-disulfide isomerase